MDHLRGNGTDFFSIASVLDKFLTEKYITNPKDYFIVINLLFIYYIVLIPFFKMPPLLVSLLAFLSGFLHMLGIWFYTKAIKIEEASVIAPLFQMIPIFTLLISFLFFRAVLTPKQLAAFVIILVASLILTLKDSKSFRLNKSFYLMLGCTALFAINGVIREQLFNVADVWSILIFYSLGHLIGIIPFLRRKNMDRIFKSKGKGLAMLSAAFATVGIVLTTIALIDGPVSLVSVFGGLQVLSVFVITLFLARFFPKLLKERLTLIILVKKGVALTMILVGIILLNL